MRTRLAGVLWSSRFMTLMQPKKLRMNVPTTSAMSALPRLFLLSFSSERPTRSFTIAIFAETQDYTFYNNLNELQALDSRQTTLIVSSPVATCREDLSKLPRLEKRESKIIQDNFLIDFLKTLFCQLVKLICVYVIRKINNDVCKVLRNRDSTKLIFVDKIRGLNE